MTLIPQKTNDFLDFHEQTHQVGKIPLQTTPAYPDYREAILTEKQPSSFSSCLGLKIARHWMKNELRQAHKKAGELSLTFHSSI